METEIAVREGVTNIILTDKGINEKNECSYNSCCWGSSFIFESKLGLRGFCSINVETSETLDTHSFAVLIGVGATTINPYLAIDSIYQRHEKNYTEI